MSEHRPASVTLGGEELLWGRDDVLDFLSQFGHAFASESMWPFLYLGEPGCENLRGAVPYLFACGSTGPWKFFVQAERYEQFADGLEAVRRYLSLKEAARAEATAG